MFRALTIAGSDSSGGAGIQADLKVFQVFGVFGMTAVTSITAQNTFEVSEIYDVPGMVVYLQIKAVVEDIGVDAAKTGMLSQEDIIENVARAIKDFRLEKLVVDPVMVAKSGAELLRSSAIESFIKEVIPKALVITPNIREAEKIANVQIRSKKDMKDAAKAIYALGAKCVIVKGGHIKLDDRPGSVTDIVYLNGEFYELVYPFVETKNTHGTGCTFSAAITANLAKGKDILTSVRLARAYLQSTIENSLNIGRGAGPVSHEPFIL